MSAESFRLSPNSLLCGETVTVHTEWAPPEGVGERVSVELVETDEQGQAAQVVARFAAKLTGSAGTWGFDEVERQSVPADVAGDMELPEPALEKSRDGLVTIPGTETTWQRAHVKVVLQGSAEEHVVILRVAETSDSNKREKGVFELGLVVKDSAGRQLYTSGTQITFVDCWKALSDNCVAAVTTMHDVHHYLCGKRKSGGDYYGSKSYGSMKAGKKITDCVTYAIQVLERAYTELRAQADYRYLHTKNSGGHKRYHMGSLFAPALHELGWELVLFGRDEADLKKRRFEDYVAGKFTQAKSKGTLFGRPCEVVGDYNPEQDWDTNTTRPANAEALARYDAIKDVPFGIIALSLGSHVVMKVGAEIYECHWDRKSTEADLFDKVSKSWEDLKHDSVFLLACPAYALREIEAANAAPENGGGE